MNKPGCFIKTDFIRQQVNGYDLVGRSEVKVFYIKCVCSFKTDSNIEYLGSGYVL